MLPNHSHKLRNAERYEKLIFVCFRTEKAVYYREKKKEVFQGHKMLCDRSSQIWILIREEAGPRSSTGRSSNKTRTPASGNCLGGLLLRSVANTKNICEHSTGSIQCLMERELENLPGSKSLLDKVVCIICHIYVLDPGLEIGMIK